MTETVVIQRTEYPDSIEIGKLGKGGSCKVYIDATDLTGAKRKIDNLVEARSHLIARLAEKGVHFDA
ncbi:hypothetical protein [Methanoregula sp.]|uniref:hypothetical protein n=1 Tax=Methanoregula sp. TaxID=2052170 RepID=UPI000CC5DC31|nr:hypothetical protein [Methanoregula sp.]PKG31785.1 MAG: hypothetical protein CW742_11580 [Methanoregula sp.]